MEGPPSSIPSKNNLNELLFIGDSARLAQVFSNLVSHALKVSNPGSPVWIEAVWCPKNLIKQGTAMIASMDSLKKSQYAARGSMKVAVKDCGPGLTAGNLKKVFSDGLQQFHAHKLVAGGGSGLELWRCHLRPRAHGLHYA
eukprot:gene67524-92498_t